jgi:hypothetical protein
MSLHQGVCTANDLANVEQACTAGAHTGACNDFFAFEAQQSPACGNCLSAFDYDFTELQGLLACVAPFVGTSCNHESACVVDCANAVCSRCPDPATALQCETQELTAGGSCASYAGSTVICVGMGTLVNAPFCSPNAQGQFGTWIETVGSQFCGK